MLLTPQTVIYPPHEAGGVQMASARNYIVPGLPVTPLPKPVPMRRVSARTMAVEMPAAPLPTPAHPLVLRFGFNRWKLTGADMAKLYALPIARYRVSGYASPPGSAAYNQKISTERARVAAKFLEMLGSHAVARGYGAPKGVSCPAMLAPRDCLPGLREDKVVITRISPHALRIRVLPMQPGPGPVVLSGDTPPALSASLPAGAHPTPRQSLLKAFAGDEAFWNRLLLHPGDLRDVAHQLAKATGYRVTVSGPGVALHDLGMPWNKTVKAAVVLDILQRQPFFLLKVSPRDHAVSIQVDLSR